jgi:hypothetical protein
MEVPGRSPLRAVRALCLAGAALACLFAAQTASAQDPAVSTVPDDVCGLASNAPLPITAMIIEEINTSGLSGASAKFCDKFTKQAIKACLNAVKVLTECRVPLQDLQGEYLKIFQCAGITDKKDLKSCQKNVDADVTDANNVATEVVQLLGDNTCNQTFATNVNTLCLNGAP